MNRVFPVKNCLLTLLAGFALLLFNSGATSFAALSVGQMARLRIQVSRWKCRPPRRWLLNCPVKIIDEK
jgi:hypothetical protein